MTVSRGIIVGLATCLVAGGCTSLRAPIVAGAYDTIGMSAAVGPQEQGASFVFGYKGAKLAVVPVEGENGAPLVATSASGATRGFSVFAMLGVDAKGGTGAGIGVQQVVAVGPAAEIWARRASTDPKQH